MPVLNKSVANSPVSGRALYHAAKLAIYIHWPYCLAKCPYCDFNSHVARLLPSDQRLDEARYVKAIMREMDEVANCTRGFEVTSVFFGGGTPSLMAPATVGMLLDEIAARWSVAAPCEITLEANPTSAEAGRFAGYRAAGVNRVSVGLQALDDRALRALGREHTQAEGRAAIELAGRLFERFSFDLISAREQQSAADWQRELREALKINADHMSVYQLTIEPGTPFFRRHERGQMRLPTDQTAEAIYEITQELTAQAGLPAYEISNHARPGEESRHNLSYWRYGYYAGFGPGAHGRLPGKEGKGPERYATCTEKIPHLWAQAGRSSKTGAFSRERLDRQAQITEALLMGLRLREGVCLPDLAAAFDWQPDPEALGHLLALGLIEDWRPARRLQASAAGRFRLNSILAELL